MTAKFFADSNVVLYTIGKDPHKAEIARAIIALLRQDGTSLPNIAELTVGAPGPPALPGQCPTRARNQVDAAGPLHVIAKNSRARG